MSAVFRSDGYRVTFSPSGAIAAGAIVKVGQLVGVATRSSASGETNEIQIGGVYQVDVTGLTLSAGDFLTVSATDAATGNSVSVKFGVVLNAISSTDTTALAILDPFANGLTTFANGLTTGTKLTAPTVTAAAASSTTATLSGLTNANASRWEIRQATNETGLTSASSSIVTPSSSGVVTVSNLSASTAYYWQARAVADGYPYVTSDWSTAASATTSES